MILQKYANTLLMLKIVVSSILFFIIRSLGEIDSFSDLVVALLEFIIILEIVRMLIEFIFSNDNRLNLRLMIDSTIIFFIRDLMLIANEHFDTQKMYVLVSIIAALFVFRVMAMKYSPEKLEPYVEKRKANLEKMRRDEDHDK